MITTEQLQLVRRDSRKATLTTIALVVLIIGVAICSTYGWIWLIRMFQFAKLLSA